ncbi:hypothetical protein C8Q75DRAFT_803990 [Abortiporus biennis]|nr:hypothetical protein C8Q75DRAFT_803990 [Abortiporus biennis]
MASGRKRLRQDGAAPVPTADNQDEVCAVRQAVMAVVQVWLDRLQLISVITTFFASTDGLLLNFTTSLAHISEGNRSSWSRTVQTMNACMAGALIFHVCSAMTSFIASFMLIRFKLHNARMFEDKVEDSTGIHIHHPRRTSTSKDHVATSVSSAPAALDFVPQSWTSFSDTVASTFQGRVSVGRIHPFAFLSFFHFHHAGQTPRDTEGSKKSGEDSDDTKQGTDLHPPIHLLARAHTLSVFMAVCGFVLSLTGILTFAWVALPTSISIFSSCCLGFCAIAGVIVFNS